VRRGLALIIESDFYATDAGRQHFADQLTSIRYCVQETCNFDTLYAYLSATNYDFAYERGKNLRSKRNIKTAMNHEIMLYGIAQKEQMGFDKAVEECKYRMSRYGVTPNMLVLPPQMLLYMALAPEQKLTYKEGGPQAEARFEGGVAGFEARTFRGCGVFTSEPFEVSDDADSVQMLTRNSQVGEFYVMSPPQINPNPNAPQQEVTPAQIDAAGAEYKALPYTIDAVNLHTSDIMIYDEESDRHVRVTWESALEATMVDAAVSEAVDVAAENLILDRALSTGSGEVTTLKKWQEDANTIKLFNTQTAGVFVTLQGEERVTKKGIPKFQDINSSCRIVVARPFIEHMMHNVILTVAGRDTGATLFGPADMQLSANTQVKTIEGHYTGHFKAVVTKPQNVMVMRDVACAGYVAGCNTRWFGKSVGKAGFDTETARRNIMNRLSFSDEDEESYGSMLAFPCNEGQFESGKLDTTMSVTSRILPWEVVGGDSLHSSFPGGESMYTFYNELLGLDSVHYGSDMKAAENQEFISQGSTNNATCFIGPHRKYDPFTKSFMSLIPGQGHFGPDAIPGDARWRRGESVSLKTARDSMTSLEVASHAQMAFSHRSS
tara:strand:- start:3955 stop:5772 length:1818 start_codon:yes stop_codon:yes gene_type:complete